MRSVLSELALLSTKTLSHTALSRQRRSALATPSGMLSFPRTRTTKSILSPGPAPWPSSPVAATGNFFLLRSPRLALASKRSLLRYSNTNFSAFLTNSSAPFFPLRRPVCSKRCAARSAACRSDRRFLFSIVSLTEGPTRSPPITTPRPILSSNAERSHRHGARPRRGRTTPRCGAAAPAALGRTLRPLLARQARLRHRRLVRNRRRTRRGRSRLRRVRLDMRPAGRGAGGGEAAGGAARRAGRGVCAGCAAGRRAAAGASRRGGAARPGGRAGGECRGQPRGAAVHRAERGAGGRGAGDQLAGGLGVHWRGATGDAAAARRAGGGGVVAGGVPGAGGWVGVRRDQGGLDGFYGVAAD
mmetsp:Transcript_29434/g.71618  ORF Transcript_29434/g.71618 Transcript_29434/m.71618 type:complete len:358 (-) Transcript_29434:869-1942(-)